jgi:Sulfate permease family
MSYAKVSLAFSLKCIISFSLDRDASSSIWPLLVIRRRFRILCKYFKHSLPIADHNLSLVQFFATSKDVSIGPVAVMSLEVSKIIARVQEQHKNKWSAPQIATTTAFICGFIVLGIGILRIGRIVELIPAPAVSGFMTGSALNILVGQVPGLFGINNLFK